MPPGLIVELKVFSSNSAAKKYIESKFDNRDSDVKPAASFQPTTTAEITAKPIISPEKKKIDFGASARKSFRLGLTSEAFDFIRNHPESVDLFCNIKHVQTVAQTVWMVHVVHFNNAPKGFQYNGANTFVV